MASSLYFVTSSLPTEELLVTAVEGNVCYGVSLWAHYPTAPCSRRGAESVKDGGMELSSQRGPSGLNESSGLNAYLSHGLSLRLMAN